MDRIALDLGFIQIYWYSIFIFIGVLFGGTVIISEAKKKKLNTDFVSNLIFYSIVFGLIGARLYYCLFNWDYYKMNPIEILEIWNGGLAIHGGIIFGALFAFLYCLKNKIKYFKVTDIIVPGLILGQAVGRWGNFFNGEAFGREVTRQALEKSKLPSFIIDGMNIKGTYYEPTFLYESIWNITGFIILLIARKYKYLKNGQLTGIYLIWYSIGRFIIEGFRSDSLMLGNLRAAQIVSIALIIIGTMMFILCGLGPKFENSYKEDFAEMKY